MESKYSAQPRPSGPHTAHTLFKIVAGLLLALFYTITTFYGLATALKISFFIYAIIPFLIHFSDWIQKSLIFMHNVWWPPTDPAYFTPAHHSVEGGRNFYVDPSSGKEAKSGLGVWHILPASLAASAASKATDVNFWRRTLATSGKPIVMYFHGNMGSRATAHRVDLYKMIRDENMFDCHVIAFDYSGFADSEPHTLPSETSVVQDSLAAYKWICNAVASSSNGSSITPKFYVWGHSLGTSISTHLLAKLQDPASSFRKDLGVAPLQPSGLVLEAPFTTMAETFRWFPLNVVYYFWPTFDWLFVLPLYTNDIAFETDSYMRDLNRIPVLVFHATADAIVPYELGEKLYKRVKIAREACSSTATAGNEVAPIYFHELSDIPYELAHTFQYTHTKFPKAAREFFVSCQNR